MASTTPDDEADEPNEAARKAEPNRVGPHTRDLLGFRPSHRAGLSWARVAAGGRMRRYLQLAENAEGDEEEGE